MSLRQVFTDRGSYMYFSVVPDQMASGEPTYQDPYHFNHKMKPN